MTIESVIPIRIMSKYVKKNNIKALLFIAVNLLLLIACKERYTTFQTEDPAKYHQFVTFQQDRVSKAILDFSGLLLQKMNNQVSADDVEIGYKRLTETSAESLEQVYGMAKFKEDDSYKKAIVELLEFYDKQTNSSFLKLKDIILQPNSNALSIVKVMSDFEKNQKSVNERFLLTQKIFMERYGVVEPALIPEMKETDKPIMEPPVQEGDTSKKSQSEPMPNAAR